MRGGAGLLLCLVVGGISLHVRWCNLGGGRPVPLSLPERAAIASPTFAFGGGLDGRARCLHRATRRSEGLLLFIFCSLLQDIRPTTRVSPSGARCV